MTLALPIIRTAITTESREFKALISRARAHARGGRTRPSMDLNREISPAHSHTLPPVALLGIEDSYVPRLALSLLREVVRARGRANVRTNKRASDRPTVSRLRPLPDDWCSVSTELATRSGAHQSWPSSAGTCRTIYLSFLCLELVMTRRREMATATC